MKKTYPHIYLTLYGPKGKRRCFSAPRTKQRKIYARIGRAGWQKCMIRVEYGRGKDVFGKTVMFRNEGKYCSVEDAKQALAAFIT